MFLIQVAWAYWVPASSSANWVTKLVVKYLLTPEVVKDLVGRACGGRASTSGASSSAVLDLVQSYFKDSKFLAEVSKSVDAWDLAPVLKFLENDISKEAVRFFKRALRAWAFFTGELFKPSDEEPPVWGPGLLEPPGGPNYSNR